MNDNQLFWLAYAMLCAAFLVGSFRAVRTCIALVLCSMLVFSNIILNNV